MIPVFKPSFGEEELEALREPFKTGWIGLGPKTREFERRFGEYIGTRFSVALNSGTAALHVVHYGRHACDMGPILEIAKERKIPVVEDAAHGCGGEYKGQRLGSLGDLGCFSFDVVKNLSTGEGGMITTDDPELYGRLLKLRWLGISKDT